MKNTEKEIQSVFALEPFNRYQYLIKIADNEHLYSLKSKDGNWAISQLEGNNLFPIWSSKEFATNCLIDGWAGFEFEEISLEIFKNNLVNFIENEKFLLNVFPVNSKTGFVLSVDEFVRDLDEELKKYE
jgi:hypothetical protein